MANKNITTSAILGNLFKAVNISRFIKRNREHMNQVPFHEHISRLCKERDTVPERVILKSGIVRTYGHQFFTGSRKPSRDKVIQLAFGFEMTYEEAQELLKVARKSPLYPKIERDAALIYALEKRLTVVETQAMLKELNLPVLGREDI